MTKIEKPPSLLLYFFLLFFVFFAFVEVLSLSYFFLLPSHLVKGSPLFVWLQYPFLVSIFTNTLLFPVSFLVTRHRKKDPYRFATRQYRFAIISNENFEALKKNFANINMCLETNEKSEELESIRFSKKIEKKSPNEFNLDVNHLYIVTCNFNFKTKLLVLDCFVQMRPNQKRIANFSPTNLPYNLLEEIIDKTNLEPFLVNQEGKPINRKWEIIER